MTESFLDSIAMTRTIPCPADPGRIIVVGRPSRGMAEVLPYLASLPSAIAYNPEAVALTLRRDPGFIPSTTRSSISPRSAAWTKGWRCSSS